MEVKKLEGEQRAVAEEQSKLQEEQQKSFQKRKDLKEILGELDGKIPRQG
jgi:hypothetical protein